MSWGTELWDQLDRVTDHTNKGIDFCEKYSHFLKDRAKVEVDYANALRKLAKNYLPKKKEDESPFTVVKAFHDSLKEVKDIAGQHDLLAEQLKNEVLNDMVKLAAELKVERKKHMDKAKQLEAQLNSQQRQLEQAKRKYARAYDDQLKAEEMYRTADSNLNLSRAEVEKAKTTSYQRTQYCSDCKAGYAQAREHFNTHQRDYYYKYLPEVFQALQDMDENRIMKVQQSLKRMSEEEKNIQPIINTCLEGVTTASSKIDHSEDSRRFVEKYSTGFQPPEDQPFDDLSNGDARTQPQKVSRERADTKKKTKEKSTLKIFSGGRSTSFRIGKGEHTKRWSSEVEKEDFSHLPPQQQKKQLKEKIKSIKHQITKECAEREGLVKMQEVYRGNPKLGDANSVSGQLEDNKQKIDALEAEMAKYENFLSGAEGNGGTPRMVRRSSVGSYNSTNSADINPSATSVNGSTPSNLSVPQETTSARQTQDARMDSFDDDNDFEEDLPVVGKAKALYPFEATTSGSVSMVANEELSIVDNDNGDGWTRVRKGTGEEGFVPTSYIEIH